MDPLSALRDFTVRNELDRIVLVGEEYRFGDDYSFSSTAETAYRSKQGNLYTLETLVFYLRNRHLRHTEYLQSARLHRVPPVTLPDRKHLLDYLDGHVSTTDSVDFVSKDPTFLSTSGKDVNVFGGDDEDRSKPSIPGAVDGSDDFVSRSVVPEIDYMEKLRAIERPLKDRETLLECKNKDFYAVFVAAMKKDEERQRTESQQRKDGLVAKSRLMGSDDHHHNLHHHHHNRGGIIGGDDSIAISKQMMMHLKSGKLGEGVPIILVPSASQTLITIYNVREFLEDGIYVPMEKKMSEMKAAGLSKPDVITVQKKLNRDRMVVAYEVRDKPTALKKEDWDRVVSVFVLGKEWQFKDWPFRDHAEIFSKSKYENLKCMLYLIQVLVLSEMMLRFSAKVVSMKLKMHAMCVLCT